MNEIARMCSNNFFCLLEFVDAVWGLVRLIMVLFSIFWVHELPIWILNHFYLVLRPICSNKYSTAQNIKDNQSFLISPFIYIQFPLSSHIKKSYRKPVVNLFISAISNSQPARQFPHCMNNSAAEQDDRAQRKLSSLFWSCFLSSLW